MHHFRQEMVRTIDHLSARQCLLDLAHYPFRLLPGFIGPVPSAALDKCYFVRRIIHSIPMEVKGYQGDY